MRGGVIGTQPRGRRLVSRQLRPALFALIVLAVALVAVLGVAYAGSSSPGRIDRAVDGRLIAHFGDRVGLVRGLADLGDPVPVVVATVLLVIGLVLLGRPRAALLAAGAPTVATVLTDWLLKPLIDRTHAGGTSFPSGHATGFCVVVFVVIAVVLDQTPPRLPVWLQVLVSLGAVGLALCVMAALAAAQYHYATDTLGGAGVALVSVLTLCLAIDWWADRPRR